MSMIGTRIRERGLRVLLVSFEVVRDNNTRGIQPSHRLAHPISLAERDLIVPYIQGLVRIPGPQVLSIGLSQVR